MLLLANDVNVQATQAGIGLGSIVAAVTSWDRSRSVFWAIVAGALSWAYVVYFVLTRPDEATP